MINGPPNCRSSRRKEALDNDEIRIRNVEGIPKSEGPRVIDRREFLWRFGGGLGGIALAHLLGRNGLLAGTPAVERLATSAGASTPTAGLHHPAKAKRVVQLFMS